MGPPPRSSLSNTLAIVALGFLLISKEINGATNGGRSSAGSQQQQTPADFDCPEEFGYYAHPTDCTLYYVCVFGGALLESCTGGLMYSHELQTCDWPRNVGCAPGQQQPQISQSQQQHHSQKVSQQPVSQQVDTPSRGRQRQQQIQIPKADLYTEEEDLGPAEELESDRQQRVYRGQPSTLGQVASDRDGLTHTNAIPVPSTGGRDKLSVVSYGAQQQYNRASVQPVQQQVYDTRGYNTTRYIQQQQYDPNYYTVYDEEAEQYKDIGDYAQYVQQNKQDGYARKKPSVEIVQQEQLQRGYVKNKYSNQPENIYQSVTPQEYDSYSIQTNDDIPYRQVQTKTNNRYPEVKESVATQGERSLSTLSTKYSEGTIQSNSPTNTDRSNGRLRSEPVVTEGSVVNITPRKNDRTSNSAEQTASRRSHSTSFAEQINALAPTGVAEDPVDKALETLTKSEEYLSDEASTERSSEIRSSSEEGSESKPLSLTVEEFDIDYLKKIKSQSSSSTEGSLNRFRFTPRNQNNPKGQSSEDLNRYTIGANPSQSTPAYNSVSEPRSRQAKLVEITTPKPLIFRIPEAFGSGINGFEQESEQTRSSIEGSSQEQRDFNVRQATNTRLRDNQGHRSSESNEKGRRNDQYVFNNRGQQQQRSKTGNDSPSYDYRSRSLSRNNDSRQKNTVSGYSLRADQFIPRTVTSTTPPLRGTAAHVTASDDESLREQFLRQYNARIEETRKQQPLESTSLNENPRRNSGEWSNDNLHRKGVLSTEASSEITTEGNAKHLLIRIPVDTENTTPQQRTRLTPLSDYVNSNVNIMVKNTGRNHNLDSSFEVASGEEQASQEARRPISIRVPESVTRKNLESEGRSSLTHPKQRKPIRYTDSSEYNDQKSSFESARGTSRFTPSSEEEFTDDELTNMTEEPRRRPVIRLPERTEPTAYRGRNEKANSRENYNAEVTSRKILHPTESDQKSYQQEERRRINPAQHSHEPIHTESVTEVVRPLAIRVPDSIDLNQYRSREESPAAKFADSLAPARFRGRTEEEVKQSYDERPKIRVPFTSREDVRMDDQLRNRYEAATTLRPNRVLSLPTTVKPTRPPKKFRNGTLYSDLTLPIGTDMTDTNPSGPDPSTRARPMSYIVPTTPGLTRGNSRHRGSLTYTIAPNEAEPPAQPRGTLPPQRGRPTLKPSTTVVGKAAEFVDIYRYPPSRPENVYPTPQVDKTAAKCRKDVCLLPDCYCGGKDIPGELTPEETPQIVLLTFDDSVNDLNKGLYSDLFEKGRVNPNGCPISATFYVSHEWTDYSQVQNLYATGHEIASHSVSHSFGEQFSQKKWTREIAGQREILAAYGGVKLEDIRGMRAPFLAVGGNKMFKMLYDSNFTYDSSMPVYENRPPSWPYTLDYKIFHDCMIPPCPTKSYPGVWEVPMVMWQDLNGGRCSMGDACSNPPTSDGVYKMLIKNFERHFTSNRAPFGLFYHAAWFTQPHHKEGFISFLDTINKMPEVWIITNWQAIQWVRDPTPLSRLGNFAPFQCNYPERPKKCNNPKVCNLWHKSGVRYMRTCQACPDIYPWTGKSGVRNSRIDNDLE